MAGTRCSQVAALGVIFVVYAGSQGGGFGHGYFRSSAVRTDAILAVRDDQPAGEAHGRPLEPIGNSFWRIRDDYLQ